MDISAVPYTQGKMTVVSGPVQSDKNGELESFLNRVVDSGYKTKSNVIAFRHPSDDPNPERLGRHPVTVAYKADQIYRKIKPDTRTIIIAGISHFLDPKIISLLDATVRSNRDVIVSGLNLGMDNQPYGIMPEVMALADKVILTKAICYYPGCREEANRSVRSRSGTNPFVPACSHHSYFNCPPIASNQRGHLSGDFGGMFSEKTNHSQDMMKRLEKLKISYLVFKWCKDLRYGDTEVEPFSISQIHTHDHNTISAINVRDHNDIKKVLMEKIDVKDLFIDELHFFQQIYQFISDSIAEGYRIHVTGLPRSFKRRVFNDVSKVMCLADVVNMHHAICVECAQPATESQRMKLVDDKKVPVDFNDPLILPGGTDSYQARCLCDWELPGEPDLEFKLEKFVWK